MRWISWRPWITRTLKLFSILSLFKCAKRSQLCMLKSPGAAIKVLWKCHLKWHYCHALHGSNPAVRMQEKTWKTVMQTPLFYHAAATMFDLSGKSTNGWESVEYKRASSTHSFLRLFAAVSGITLVQRKRSWNEFWFPLVYLAFSLQIVDKYDQALSQYPKLGS